MKDKVLFVYFVLRCGYNGEKIYLHIYKIRVLNTMFYRLFVEIFIYRRINEKVKNMKEIEVCTEI